MKNKYANEIKQISFNKYTIKGLSRAGIGTCIAVPEMRLAFDVAQGYAFAVPVKHHLVSHCHQDHASGIPYLISQKALMNIKGSTFYLPKGSAESIDQIIKLWQKLEGHTYDYHLEEVELDKSYNLDTKHFFKAYPTIHRIFSQGYTIYEKRKHLKKEFKNLSTKEIVEAKNKGLEIENQVNIPKISFSGDTKIEFLDQDPDIVKAETLILEVTYIDQQRSVEHARKWGHIHLDEVLSRINKMENKNIVFIHLSAKYQAKELRQIIKDKAPEHSNRIHILI